MPDPEAEREAMAEVLMAHFNRTIETMAGKLFADTKVEPPRRAVFIGYAALLAAGYFRTASEIYRLREIVAELRAALAPVARLATAIDRGRAMNGRERTADDCAVAGMNDVLLTYGDLRRACALLQDGPDAEGRGPDG